MRQWLALLVIVVAAAAVDTWHITTDGLEAYYAAGVRSMAGNWHDFLYGAFDANGLISLDKLPGPFWAQALSVRAFGLSVWAMVLPQVLWSVLTVVAVFVSARRVAGPAAGLGAAALFVISPVTILSAHGNLGDPLFVLLSVLAADAVLRAASGGRAWWLAASAVWAGLAFQVKMTEAWLLAAVLAVAYLLAGPPGLGRRLARLAVAAPVLAAVSLAWMTVVTLAPASHRPYADGSRDNSVFAQVFSYNGWARFGSRPAYGLGYLVRPSAASVVYARRSAAIFVPLASRTGAGWDRLLIAPAAQLTGWLLVPAVVVAVAGIVAACRARGQAERRQYAPLLLWGLWLIVLMVVFSVGRDVQGYYFGMLSPAIAILSALGAKAALGRFTALRWRLALAAGVTVTAVCSAVVLSEAGPSWRVAALAIGAVGLAAGITATGLIVTGRGRGPLTRTKLAKTALALAAAAALTGPLIADGWSLAHRAGPFDTPLVSGGMFSANIPEASQYPGYGGTILPETPAALWQQIQIGGQKTDSLIPPGKWFAVYGSAASGYVLGGARRVLPIGGFTGSAPSPTAARLTRMLARGQIALAEIPGPGDIRYDDPRVQAIVRDCTQLDHIGDTTARARVYDCRKA